MLPMPSLWILCHFTKWEFIHSRQGRSIRWTSAHWSICSTTTRGINPGTV
jgi:hypothetical protein